MNISHPLAVKKSVNLSIDADLLKLAKQLNFNLSQIFEAHLNEIVRQTQRTAWLAENRGALDEYNRRIESDGVFSDGLRHF